MTKKISKLKFIKAKCTFLIINELSNNRIAIINTNISKNFKFELKTNLSSKIPSKKNKEQFNSDVQGFSTFCIVWPKIMANGSQMTAITAKTYKKNT